MRRAGVRAAAHEVSDHRMASGGGDVAGDDRNDFEVGALGWHATNGTCRSRSSRSSQNWTFLALCFVVLAMGRTEEVWSLRRRNSFLRK